MPIKILRNPEYLIAVVHAKARPEGSTCETGEAPDNDRRLWPLRHAGLERTESLHRETPECRIHVAKLPVLSPRGPLEGPAIEIG
jgi:hypothetical protein